MKLRHSIFSILVLGLLSGCVAKPHLLKKEATEKIDSVEQVIIVKQNNLDVTVTPGNPGSSGLLGALIVAAIDEARRSSAQDEAQPIITALNGYDFRQVMLEKMKAAIAASDALPYQIQSNIETIDSESMRWSHFDKTKADAVLFSQVDYKLISGKLVVGAAVNMFPKSSDLNKYRENPGEEGKINSGNQIYRQKFHYERQAVYASNIRDSLNEAAESIARQLVTDLAHPQ